nr:MAG TPA: hypothetical protein [Caudoviricetes sp.]
MSLVKRLTSFMKLQTGEGDRIAFSYSTIDTDSGKVVEQNLRGNFLILDDDLAAHVKAIEEYIKQNKLN